MSEDPYSERVRRLFADPAHAGVVEGGIRVAHAAQGVRVAFSGKLVDGTIAALRFEAWGCPHVIAAAEYVCANCEGRPLSELEAVTAAGLVTALSAPITKTGRILVVEDALRSLGMSLGGKSPGA